MFKRASFRRSSNPTAGPAPSASSPASSSSSALPPATPAAQPSPAPSTSSLLSRFKPSPKTQPSSLPPPPAPPTLSRANTLPAIESSVNSSRSSFTSVSTATRADEGANAKRYGADDGDDDVWGQEEEEGRTPLVELSDDDDADEPRAGAAIGSSAAAVANGHAGPGPNGISTNGNGHASKHAPPLLSSSLPTTSSRPPSPSHPTAPSNAPASPTASNGARPQDGHHHREHTHHASHHHSPPVAGPPPIRAATLSGLKDVASIAAASIVAKEQAAAAAGGKKKKAGGFMSSFGRKPRDPTLEGALALASLPSAVQPAEELTPQVRMERAKQAERAHLLQICMELGVEIYDIAPDGHCMYAAVADQLAILKVIKEDDNNPRTTRAAAADYMLGHPDAFLPFLVGSAQLEFGEADDGAFEGETEEERLRRYSAVEDDMMSEKAFKRYCDRVRESGEWGGEPEILALSRFYQVPIHVIQSNHPKIVVHSPDPKAKATLDPRSARKIKAVRISYHRRLYGLGEHYNSLRKITYSLSAFSAMVPM